MTTLDPPYWVATDSLPGLDFNRMIVEPGTCDQYPDGALGLYVDDDFWCVAALPLSYRDWSIEDLVAHFFPTYAEQATYAPDHGSIEQQVYFARSEAQSERARYEAVWEELTKARAELARLRKGRTDISPRRPKRLEMQTNYFVRQYEHLLIAMAHEAIPYVEDHRRGVCSICGLLNTDRVHQPAWIEKHEAGYPASMSIDHIAADDD